VDKITVFVRKIYTAINLKNVEIEVCPMVIPNDKNDLWKSCYSSIIW